MEALLKLKSPSQEEARAFYDFDPRIRSVVLRTAFVKPSVVEPDVGAGFLSVYSIAQRPILLQRLKRLNDKYNRYGPISLQERSNENRLSKHR